MSQDDLRMLFNISPVEELAEAGYVIVPILPSLGMVMAGIKEKSGTIWELAAVWRAMLASAMVESAASLKDDQP